MRAMRARLGLAAGVDRSAEGLPEVQESVLEQTAPAAEKGERQQEGMILLASFLNKARLSPVLTPAALQVRRQPVRPLQGDSLPVRPLQNDHPCLQQGG